MGFVDTDNRRPATVTKVAGTIIGGLELPGVACCVAERRGRHNQPAHIRCAAGATAHGAVAVGNRNVVDVEFISDLAAEAAAFVFHRLNNPRVKVEPEPGNLWSVCRITFSVMTALNPYSDLRASSPCPQEKSDASLRH